MKRGYTFEKAIQIVEKYRRIKIVELCKELNLTYHYCRYWVVKPLLILHPEIVLVHDHDIDYLEYRPKAMVFTEAGGKG